MYLNLDGLKVHGVGDSSKSYAMDALPPRSKT